MKNYSSLCVLFFVVLFSSCDDLICKTDIPGTTPNPKLIEIFNEKLQSELISRADTNFHPNLLPNANLKYNEWLQKIKYAETYCKCKGQNNKFNKLIMKIVLTDGTEIKEVYTGHTCTYLGENSAWPTVLKVEFENGKVTSVLTDGREMKNPVSFISSDVMVFNKVLLRECERQSPNEFYPKIPTQSENEKEWEMK